MQREDGRVTKFLDCVEFKKKSVKSGKVDSFVRKWVRMVGFVVDDGDVNVSYHGEKDIFVNEDVRVLCIIFQNLFDLRNEKKRKKTYHHRC